MQVVLKVNGVRRCTWGGTALRGSAAPICSELVAHLSTSLFTSMKSTNVSIMASLLTEGELSRDEESDLRTFTLTFQRRGIRKHTTFEWIGKRDRLVVTVDWHQGGE